jgi:hypothetical protein
MSGTNNKLSQLVRFDHWSWVVAIGWFAVAIALMFISTEIGRLIVYWGIVLVLVNNFSRLMLLAMHFRAVDSRRLWWLTILLAVLMLVSIVVQYAIRK